MLYYLIHFILIIKVLVKEVSDSVGCDVRGMSET